jgi:hypothetical protein
MVVLQRGRAGTPKFATAEQLKSHREVDANDFGRVKMLPL